MKMKTISLLPNCTNYSFFTKKFWEIFVYVLILRPYLYGNNAITTYGEKSNDYTLRYPVNRSRMENLEEFDLFKRYCKNMFDNQLQMEPNKINV